MHALVVVAHPRADSLTHAIADRAVSGLERAGNDVRVLDLYGIGFRAAMSRDERAAYHTDAPILDPQVAESAALLQRSEIVVFVYPTWWSGMPAIMKGWLERVMVPGVGFRFDARGKVRPGLAHVRHIVGISTYGSPRWYVRLVNDNGRRTVTRAFRMSCGWRARPTWLGLAATDSTTEAERRRFLDDVESAMAALTGGTA